MAGRPSKDEGFSLLEVLFAAFIAFFVLTALFGVLVMSATEGRVANADTVSTSLAQLVVEQARSAKYESVGVTPTPAGQISGALASSETTVYQGITFLIQREVIWVDDAMSRLGPNSHDYKQLTVRVSWAGGHATPVVTFIRDHTNETPTPPVVEWLASPGANAVLFSDSVSPDLTQIWDHSGNPDGTLGLASLQASASVVTTTGVITRMEFQNNGMLFGDPWTGPAAPAVLEWPTPAFPIDLTLTTMTPSGETTTVFKEGMNTLKVVATANNLAYAYQILLLLVDNEPPEFASGDGLTLTVPDRNTDRYNGALDMSWPPAMDGNDPAPYYDVIIETAALPSPSVAPFQLVDLGTTGADTLQTGMPPGFTAKPFTAYHVTLQPRSIRSLTGVSSASNSGYACTSPRLTGSVFNQASNKKATPNYRFDLLIAPFDEPAILSAFGGTSIRYDVYSMSGVGYTYPGTGDLPSSAFVEAADQAATSIAVQSKSVCNKYLQVEAKIMDADGVTVLHRVRSNVVGNVVTGPSFQLTKPLPVP
ncbi:MAG TPA: hypothetical protein VGK50_02265 [Coriobacteriia bacterium]|jgi:type II secretory pathway pseudopilin PulG